MKHYLQKNVNFEKSEREKSVHKIYGSGDLVDANCTIEFKSRTEQLKSIFEQKYTVSHKYFSQVTELRMCLNVPSRKANEIQNWENNNANSMNNILAS